MPTRMRASSTSGCKLEELAHDAAWQRGQAFRPRLAGDQRPPRPARPAARQGPAGRARTSTAERQALAAEKAEINALLGGAENLSIRINGMISQIADMRRELFARLLTKRYDIDYALLTQVEEDFGSASRDLYRTTSSWLRFVVQFKLQSVLSATLLALVAAACSWSAAGAIRRPVRAGPGGREPVLSQPAVGGVLVDADPDGGARRLPRRHLLRSTTISTCCAATSPR